MHEILEIALLWKTNQKSKRNYFNIETILSFVNDGFTMKSNYKMLFELSYICH